MLSSPFRQKPVLFSWRLPPHEPSSLPAGANYYTQPFYQTMLKFSIACSDKDLLLMRRQRERRRNWQAGQRGPSLLLANLRTLSSSHLASKVAWSHFSLVGEICPQAPLNDFCKIGCAPAELLRLPRVRESRRYVNVSLTYSLFPGILETEKEVTQP